MQYELMYNNLGYPLPKYTAKISKEMEELTSRMHPCQYHRIESIRPCMILSRKQ